MKRDRCSGIKNYRLDYSCEMLQDASVTSLHIEQMTIEDKARIYRVKQF